jgi:hypothetical protein
VNLGRSTTVDVMLEVGSAATEVVVNANAIAIDVSTTTAGSNVSTDQFSYFPTTRNIQGLYTIAPSATRSGLLRTPIPA